MNAQEWQTMMTILENTEESGYKRSQAFSRFIQTEAHLMYLDLITRLLVDPNQSFRNEVIRQIVRNNREDYYPIFSAALDSGDDHMIREALRGLEGCHEPALIQKVETLRESSVSSIHYESDRVLKKMTGGQELREAVILDTRQSMPGREAPAGQNTNVAKTPFTREKTAEVQLNLNMLPHDTPYPVHRSHKSRRAGSALNVNATLTQESPHNAEGIIAAIVSIGILVVVSMILVA